MHFDFNRELTKQPTFTDLGSFMYLSSTRAITSKNNNNYDNI